MTIRSDINGTDNEIQQIGRNDYERLSQKIGSGDPTQVCFEPFITEQTGSALHSRLSVWPVKNSTSVDKLILITEHYPDDLDASGNNPQFPAEWGNALIWNLALELAPEYAVTGREQAILERRAMMKKAALFGQEQENASVFMAPEGS
jgi:hypothetical protein